ncbi:MAG: cbb3-type cytochrome oxidase assembly protein CcoS [Cyclobacteriaceae bacterium]|nr:cbb3-type cytochrome oxidase assembly protein CcoS [Cyclobacteriaceae bacterium]
MSVIFILILISMVIAGGFLAAFIWAIKSGQFDDTYTPSVRILFENKKQKKKNDIVKITTEKNDNNQN